MANRIVGNVIIIDSAMANLKMLSNLAGLNLHYIHVNAVALISVDTTAQIKLTGADTADVLINLDSHDSLVHFAQPQRFYLDELKSPVVTAGTGLIYLA
jgi:hypothetical protein